MFLGSTAVGNIKAWFCGPGLSSSGVGGHDPVVIAAPGLKMVQILQDDLLKAPTLGILKAAIPFPRPGLLLYLGDGVVQLSCGG